MTTRGPALAVYACTQAPRGITDAVPVVLAMRAFALATPVEPPLDATVPIRALLDRLARMGIVGLELDIPESTQIAAWAGVLPPVAGWIPSAEIDGASLQTVAADGIARVAARLPADPGEAVVHQVRASVWGLDIAPGLPAAAAFAAESMGFLRGDETARVSRSLTWIRVSTERGHVLVRSLLG